MSRVVETSGVDVDEAVDKALEQLALNRSQVDVDVVREGKKGFLGIGAEEAIVRVTAKESAEPAAGAQRGRRGGRGRGARAGREGEGGREEGRGAGSGAGEARGGGGGRRRGGGGRRRERYADEPLTEGPAVTVPGAPEELPVAPVGEAEDEVDFAGRTVRDLLTLLGLTETEIAARDPETPGDGAGLSAQVLDIYGETEDASDELGLLIGRRGDTLKSFQYLVNVLVSGRYEGEHVFSIDVEGYRRRREESLVQMAQRIANEVRATGDVITLEPMPPAARRIVHLALDGEPGVKTESVGEGEDRQVEILPE
jgi:spoIIIJ-associated protein